MALRQHAPAAEPEPEAEPEHAAVGDVPDPAAPAVLDLEARVNHLEAAFEGLQDAMYRDAQRYEHELAELRRQLQPENLARSLSGDARRRGL